MRTIRGYLSSWRPGAVDRNVFAESFQQRVLRDVTTASSTRGYSYLIRRLARRDIDDGHAAVRCLVDFELLLHDPHVAKVVERFCKHGTGIEIFDLLARRCVLELLGRAP